MLYYTQNIAVKYIIKKPKLRLRLLYWGQNYRNHNKLIETIKNHHRNIIQPKIRGEDDDGIES